MTRTRNLLIRPYVLVGFILLCGATAQVAQESPADWPRAIEVPEARVVLYQPQPESFEGDRIAARFALSVTLTGSRDPVFGVAWVEARVETDRDARTVRVLDLSVNRVRFPESTEELERTYAQALKLGHVRRLLDDPAVERIEFGTAFLRGLLRSRPPRS